MQCNLVLLLVLPEIIGTGGLNSGCGFLAPGAPLTLCNAFAIGVLGTASLPALGFV